MRLVIVKSITLRFSSIQDSSDEWEETTPLDEETSVRAELSSQRYKSLSS